MTRKNHKLSRKNFETVFSSGKIKHSPTFVFRILKTDSWDSYAASVVVSKKVAKLATSRNRIKRRIYAILSDTAQSAKTPKRVVVVLKKDPSSLTKEQLTAELQHIFS